MRERGDGGRGGLEIFSADNLARRSILCYDSFLSSDYFFRLQHDEHPRARLRLHVYLLLCLNSGLLTNVVNNLKCTKNSISFKLLGDIFISYEMGLLFTFELNYYKNYNNSDIFMFRFRVVYGGTDNI